MCDSPQPACSSADWCEPAQTKQFPVDARQAESHRMLSCIEQLYIGSKQDVTFRRCSRGTRGAGEDGRGAGAGDGTWQSTASICFDSFTSIFFDSFVRSFDWAYIETYVLPTFQEVSLPAHRTSISQRALHQVQVHTANAGKRRQTQAPSTGAATHRT